MKKLFVGMCLLVLSSIVFAEDSLPPALLDKVAFQVSAKSWVSTQTALLTVNINATLTNADLVKARADIMHNLTSISSGDWHLVQFDRAQDSSGLEKLTVQAQARVDQGALTNIYLNAKNVSKPGASYEIGAVEFKPSLNEIQRIRDQLREKLYQSVAEEITRINKVYPGQSFSLFNVVIVDGDSLEAPKPMQRDMNTLMVATSAANLTVSNELVMTALVEVASNRKRES